MKPFSLTRLLGLGLFLFTVNAAADEVVDENADWKKLAPVFPEDRILLPRKDDYRFSLHGYFRAPLRMSWKNRGENAKPDEGRYNMRTPWLVDDDYFRSGFAYTPNQETDWSEIFLSVGNDRVTGTVVFMGSLYSDAARPLLDRQWGISQGYVTFRWHPEVVGHRVNVQLKAGAFWDRFGYIPKYDTYVFGRTHQMGEQLLASVPIGPFELRLMDGIGTHMEALDTNQGLTLLHYDHLGATYKDIASVGVYYLSNISQDKRQLKEQTDASLRIMGADARINGDVFGQLYVAASTVDATHSNFLSPSVELMHSLGGRGMTENYFGTQKSDNGSGSLFNVGVQYDYKFKTLFNRIAPSVARAFGEGDVTASIFSLYSYAHSAQADINPVVNRDDRRYFKWGADLGWRMFDWLGVSARYDHVVPDMKDDASSFRIFTPRLTVFNDWVGDGQIFVQWSRYFYGDRVRLRQGQIPLETIPDDNVIKIQAQLSF